VQAIHRYINASSDFFSYIIKSPVVSVQTQRVQLLHALGDRNNQYQAPLISQSTLATKCFILTSANSDRFFDWFGGY